MNDNERINEPIEVKSSNEALANPSDVVNHSVGERKAPFFSSISLLFLGLVIFIAWASFFEIDQAVRSQGKIIASARTQVIQAVDGGVLDKIHVKEGDVVEKGQLLAELEKERVEANLEEIKSKIASFQAAIIRAQAEILEVAPDFGDLNEEYPNFVEVQKKLYQQKIKSLNDAVNALEVSSSIAKEEYQMNKSLYNSGDSSKLEVMRSQRELSEIQSKISTYQNEFLQAAYKEISELETELDINEQKLKEVTNILDHSQLVSPADGIVKYLKVTTVGGVMRQGDELMQISPTESQLILEVKVKPMDIGALIIDMPVTIKLDAFDASVFGSLKGKLTYLSSDTLVEEVDGNSVSFYRAHILMDFDQNRDSKLSLDLIKPGMTATADIKTDKRTVLAYIMKPIVKVFSSALSER